MVNYNCEHCDYVAQYPEALRKHQKICSPDTVKFQCEICPLKFATTYYLTIHKTKVHGYNAVVQSLKCEHCDYIATSQDSIRKHQKLCGPDTVKFQCESCPLKFATMYYLTIHVIKTHGRKEKCDFCDYENNEPSKLRAHVEKCFISDESFVCDLCGKEFQSQFVLRGHKKTHTNSKVKIKIPRKRKAHEMLEQSVDEPNVEGCQNESTDVIEKVMEVHPKLNCDQCSFLGFSELGLNAHKTVEHCEDGGIKWFVKLARLNFIPK